MRGSNKNKKKKKKKNHSSGTPGIETFFKPITTTSPGNPGSSTTATATTTPEEPCTPANLSSGTPGIETFFKPVTTTSSGTPGSNTTAPAATTSRETGNPTPTLEAGSDAISGEHSTQGSRSSTQVTLINPTKRPAKRKGGSAGGGRRTKRKKRNLSSGNPGIDTFFAPDPTSMENNPERSTSITEPPQETPGSPGSGTPPMTSSQGSEMSTQGSTIGGEKRLSMCRDDKNFGFRPGFINCLQLNANKCWNATLNQILHLGEGSDPSKAPKHHTLKSTQRKDFPNIPASIVFLQEPYIHKGKIPGLPKGLGQVTGGDGSRASIIYTKDLKILPVPSLTGKDIAVASMEVQEGGKAKQILLGSIYLDRNLNGEHMFPPQLQKTLEVSQRSNIPVVLAFDANAWSASWSERTNARGDQMDELIVSHGLTVENVGRNITYDGVKGQSIPDCTLTRGISLLNWGVNSKVEGLSDHKLISFSFEGVSREHFVPTFNLKKADWGLFAENLSKLDFNFGGEKWDKQGVNEYANQLQSNIISALTSACPMTKPHTSRTPVFWSKELAKLLRILKRAKRRYNRTRTREAKSNWDKARTAFDNHLHKTRNESWRDFTAAVEDTKGMSRLMKIVAKNQLNSLGILSKEGVEYICPEDNLNLLADTHFPNSSSQRTELNKDYADVEITKEELSSREEVAFITSEKVRAAFDAFSTGKSPGEDQIRPEILHHLPDEYINAYTTLYRAIILTGHNPEVWAKARVAFLPKPGKSDYSDPRAYRPISLVSFLHKGLERLVKWNIEEGPLVQNPLHHHQHAFRAGRSCESALSAVVDRLERAIHQGHYGLVVSLDIKGAFDGLQITSIKKGFQEKGVSEHITNWYINFLSNRQARISLKGHSISRWLTQGVAQGGVLSPLAWNIAFDGLLKLINMDGALGIGFADDGAIILVGPDPKTLKTLAQQALDRAVEWGNQNGLTFCSAKTKVVLFHRKKHHAKYPANITMNGATLPFDRSLKYLGIILDDGLYFSEHIRNKIKVCKRLMVLLNKAIACTWGPLPKYMRYAYEGIIRPKLTYGALVWARYAGGFKNAFKSLQRLSMRCMCHFRHSTPTDGLQIATGLVPLDIYILEQATMAYIRTKPLATRQWNGLGKALSYKGHRRFVEDTMEEFGISINIKVDEIPRSQNWIRNFTLDRSSFDKGLPLPPNGKRVECWTDGSQTEDDEGFKITGWGGTIRLPRHLGGNKIDCKGSLASHNSVFQAEVRGIHETATKLIDVLQNTTSKEEIVFYVDNRASLLALIKPFKTVSSVKECADVLNILGAQHEVTLRWTKAHVGIAGNEAADKLAKAGCKSKNKSHIPPPKSYVKSLVHSACMRRWEKRWKKQKDCRQTRLFFLHPDKSKSKEIMTHSRHDLGLLLRTITGHSYCNRHHSVVNPAVDPTCRKCGEEEETDIHLITECEALWQIREDVFRARFIPNMTNLRTLWTPGKLMKFMNHEAVRHIWLQRDPYGPTVDPDPIPE